MALDPETGKIIKQPTTGKDVIYGIKEKNRKTIPIQTRFAQPYLKADHNGLQKIIDRTGKKDFVVYEELTKRKFEDPKTGAYKFAEKITYGKKASNQRPVLYANGRRVRELDLGFRKRSKREMVDDMLLTVVKPDGKFVRNIVLDGPTIKDTIKNLSLKITMDQVKKFDLEGIYYEIILKVIGEDPILVYGKTDTYANLNTDIARSIRFALGNRGLRFTSLVTLHDLANEALEAGDKEMEGKILTVGKDRIPVAALNPVFSENEFGFDSVKRDSRVTMDIKLSGVG